MACPEGGEHKYELQDERFVCIKCMHIASYRPAPSYTELLKENTDLKIRIAELELERR